ncbi:MAG: extracellular solute-binding protein [Anaerolineae bacterium]|nr:extracellular solute-binding protein [Anaerolineae bacterium]
MFSKSHIFKTAALLIVAAILTVTVVPSTLSAQDGVSGPLAVMGFGVGDEIASVRVDYATAAYPDLEVNITEGALDGQQFLTAVASGNSPDLVYMGRDVISTYIARGALLPLTDCIDSQAIDMSQYRQPAVDQVTFDGEVYGLPEFFNIIVVIANLAALEEAGLTLDDVDLSDWDNIAMLNETLTRFDGDTLTRIGFDPKLPEFLPLWAAANGVGMISDDGRTAQLDDPAIIEALEFSAGLHEAAGGRQDFIAFRDTWDFFGGSNQFVADQLGIFPMEQWYANVLVGASPDAPIAFMPFTGRDGEILSYATGNTWAIPRGTSNYEGACAFAKAMTSVDAWVAAAEARAAMRAEQGTTNTGVYTGNVWADEIIWNEIMEPSGNEAFDSGVQVILSTMDAAYTIPSNPAGAEFKQAWQDAVNRVLNGEQTAAESLAQAQAEAQAALDEAWGE